ncbi:hypothetical protein B0H11DRAFT_2273897 [Mycena galericulata]|nr:hypothetical protein B0H11DRAFT_2273897 [Mycena galericulata]
MLAFISLVAFAVPAAFAASTPTRNLAPRQSLTPTAGCVSACTPLGHALEAADADTSLGALCTSAIVNDYASCYDCLVASDTVTQEDAQAAVDDYAQGCTEEGFSVSSATVSGNSSGGGSGGSDTNTAAGSSTTSASTGSSSGSDTGSSSGDTGSTSSGSSGKSSTSGKGSTSGSGFKLNAAMRTSHLEGSALFLAVLAVLIMRNL